METQNMGICKIAALIAVIALVAFSGIHNVYAQSSSVASTGSGIHSEVLTVNVTDAQSAAQNDVVFNFDNKDTVISQYESGTDNKFIAVSSTAYVIHVASAGFADTTAYFSGYITCSGTGFNGAVIKSVTVNFSDTSSIVLKNSAVDAENVLQLTETDGVCSKDLTITNVEVEFYKDVFFDASHNTTVGAGSSFTSIGSDVLTDLSAVEFHFFASSGSLLTA